MSTARTTARSWLRLGTLCLAGGVLVVGLTAPVQAAPTVAQMLGFRPRQEGVVCTTPAPDTHSTCKVELDKPGKGSGWVLKDDEGNLVRRFFDSNGDNRIDVWSYYKDGVEVYREVDTTFSGKPDQYRWLNAGGSKWGIDEDRDGRIESWKVISPEEVSQEVLSALIARDYPRFQALLLTESELKGLELPAEQASRAREQLKGAQEKFQETVSKLTKLSAKSTWIHLETAAPQCVPTESGRDVIKHALGTILYETGAGNDWIQTGEMYQVGSAWRLVSGPQPGTSIPRPTVKGEVSDIDDPAVQKLVEELTELDKKAPKSEGGPSAEVAQYHLKRANLLEQIVSRTKQAQRDSWIRQLADTLSSAAQSSPSSDTTALQRIGALQKSLVERLPGQNLTAYVTFREMQASYAAQLDPEKKANVEKVQQAWIEKLSAFVQTYPQAEDTPDALLQLGQVNEFLNKEVEAKNWYAQLKKSFADRPQAAKAEGAIRRLNLEGQPLKLAGPTLEDPNQTFDVEQLHGKVVVVYYWASWNRDSSTDFTKLKQVLDNHGSKGVALVCVNLDGTAKEASAFVQRVSAPGTHLHQDGGLESKLATDYGFQLLPHLFLVGKDGKVVNRNVQLVNVEDEVKKLLK
jgi:hypothetical protein